MWDGLGPDKMRDNIEEAKLVDEYEAWKEANPNA